MQQARFVPVNGGEERELFLPQMAFDTADDHRTIWITDLCRNDPDRVSAPQPQGARPKIGLVVQLTRCSKDALLGLPGDGPARRGVVQNGRNRSGSKPDLVSDHFQGRPWFRTSWMAAFSRCHWDVPTGSALQVAICRA